MAVGMAGMSLVVVAIVLAMMVLGPLLGTGRDVAGSGSDRASPAVGLAAVAGGRHRGDRMGRHRLSLAPSRRTPWRADLPGAVLSAAVWAGVSVGLQVYLRLAANANPVLGSLGGSLIVLLWLYLLAAGLLWARNSTPPSPADRAPASFAS